MQSRKRPTRSDASFSPTPIATRLRGIDRVWAAIIIGLLFGFAVNSTQALASVNFTITALISIAPYFAVAVGIAAWTKATGLDTSIALVFSGDPVRMIFVAAIFGALSPFCSCGVIPLIASLLAMGVPLAPVMAFWLASPIMDPEMFLLTLGPLGLEFAIAKTSAAVFFGLFGGLATFFMQRAGWFLEPLKPGVVNTGCGNSCGPTKLESNIVWKFWRESQRRRIFFNEFWSVIKFLGKWMVIAFLLESLMVAYIPAEAVASLLGGEQSFAIPLATVIGVPAYMNGFAAVPLISGLIDLGMSPAAGLAFMTAGGVTSIPASIAVIALVKKPVFFWYLGLALSGSMIVGFGYSLYLT